MQQAGTGEGVALSHYFRVLQRRWWVVLLGALLGVWGALAYLWLVPQQVTATTTLSVNIITNDPFNLARSAAGLLDLESEAQVASSSVVAQRAADALEGDITEQEMRQSLDVTGVSDTSILRISVTGSTEAQAQEAADAVASEYLTYRSEQAQARIDRNLTSARSRLESLREDLAAANEARAAAAEDSQEFTQAETDRSLVTLEINTLLEEVASTQAIDTAAGSVLNPATRNPVVRTPPRELVLLTGLLLGLALGVLGAFLRTPMRRRIRSDRDVIECGGRAVLGALPGKEVGMPPADEELEALRAIRETMFGGAHSSFTAGVCGIIDECPPGRAADVPLKLAYVVAQTGLPVQFVGLDLTPDRVERLSADFGLRRDDDVEGMGRFVSDRYPNLRVFAPLSQEPAVGDEPVSRKIREELAAWRTDALVILGVPTSSTDATRLAVTRLSDMVVFTIALRVTRMQQLGLAVERVRDMGGVVVGTILVDRHRSASTGQPPVARGERRAAHRSGAKADQSQPNPVRK